MAENTVTVKRPTSIFYTIFCVLVAMVGYTIHHSLFWSIVDFFFTPFALIKWLICHQITMPIIHQTFSWFF